MKKGHFSFFIILMLSMLSLGAFADAVLSIKPTPADLSEEYLREYAARFFSKKCGVDSDLLLKAPMTFDLFQSGHSLSDDKTTIVDPYDDPRWLIRLYPSPETDHQGVHGIYLTREGGLVSWHAHGGEFFEENPDLMRMGTPADPLPTDASPEEIIEKASADLQSLYGIENAQDMIYQTAFVFHDAFNGGFFPVWLINAYEDDAPVFKGVYGYNGIYMSLVPWEQDYQEYTTPHERFFYEVFGDDGIDISSDIHLGYVSAEESIMWLKKVVPKFEEWIKEHPYYVNVSVVDELIEKYSIYR